MGIYRFNGKNLNANFEKKLVTRGNIKMMRRSRKLEGWSQALSFYCILYMFVEDKMVRWLIEVKKMERNTGRSYM